MTELVRNRTTLPDRVEVDRQLAQLALGGESETLHEIAMQASAYQAYERRNDAKARADEFGRVKVLAEAHIGWIDLRENPQPGDTDLTFGDHRIDRHIRRKWRMLGSGLQTGELDGVIAKYENDPDHGVDTWTAYRELLDRGLGWFLTKPMRKRYEVLHNQEHLTHAEIADRAGVPKRMAERYLGPKCLRVPHGYGLRLAIALGMDPTTLEPVPPHLRRKNNGMKRRLPRQRKLEGGRLDEAYSLIRKALQELDSAVGESGRWGTGEAYECLYRAETIVGRALKRAT